MARLVWAVLCRKAVIDPAGVVTLFDVTERIGVFPPPPDEMIGKALLPVELAIATYWTRSDRARGEKDRQRVRILAPDGKPLGGASSDLDLQTFVNSRNVANLPGMPYAGLGIYTVEISQPRGEDWKVVAEVPFEVGEGPDPTAAA